MIPLLAAAYFGTLITVVIAVALRAASENPYRTRSRTYALVPVPNWIAGELDGLANIRVVTIRK